MEASRIANPGAIVRAYDGRIPRVDPSAWLAPGSVIVGDVEIGEDCSIWYGTVIRGDLHRIRIGPRTNVQDQSVVHVTKGRFAAEIGAEVTVGHRAVVHGCRIGDGALIGIGAVVMDGAVVGAEALIAAGSVVTPGTVVADGFLALGTPAREIRRLTAEELLLQKERTLTYIETARKHASEPAGSAR